MQGPSIGKWTGDNLVATISANTGTRYYADLPKLTQFAHAVAKLLAVRRAKSATTLNAKPSIFVLGAPPQTTLAKKRQPTLSSGGVEVAGRVWFAPESLSTSTELILPGDDPDDNFKFVETELGAGAAPAIYFDGAASPNTMRLYPGGLASDGDCEVITIAGASLTKEALKELLDAAHERTLITPTAHPAAGRLWKDPANCFPVKQAEAGIQEVLLAALAVSLGQIRVKRENTGISGRFDLGLIEQDPLDPGKTTSHALLELKVVKTFTSTGGKVNASSNRKAVTKGLDQANAYRNEHGFHLSALCCFDMQKKHTLGACFKHEEKRAETLNVELWVWPLYSTTEAYRAVQGACT